MLQSLKELLTMDFMLNAVIAGSLISLCASLLGVSLVLKRFSMIGDGLSHVSFGTLAIASACRVAPLVPSLIITVLCAFLLLRISDSSKTRSDAAIGLISTGALAIGVMFISGSTGINIDISNYMFGSILTTSRSDVVMSTILSVAVIVLFILFYNSVFAVTFDENFSRATGTNTNLYNILLAGLTAVTIVLGMRIMGAMLISGLLVIPPLSSMRLFKSFRSVVIGSAVISLLCFFAGVVVSAAFSRPTGASIITVSISLYIVLTLIQAVLSKVKQKKTTRLTDAQNINISTE